MKSQTKAVREAAKLWLARSRRARREVIGYFLAEAKQSDEWAEEIADYGPNCIGGTVASHRDDAEAMRAAAKLLRAIGGGR